MKKKVNIGTATIEIEIKRIELINGLLDDVGLLIEQTKRTLYDRIEWNDLVEAETLLEQLQSLDNLKINLKGYKYNLDEFYPEEDKEEEDLGLTSLFG